jgi:hypothetical protein
MNLDAPPTNPYSPPEATAPAPPDVLAVRVRLLRKETILRLLGVFYLTISLAMVAVFSMAAGDVASLHGSFLLFLGILLLLASALFFGGYRLAGLRPGRRYAIVFTGLFLLTGLPRMCMELANFSAQPKTAIQACTFLLLLTSGFWVLLSRDGRFLLSPGYGPIVAATPQLQVWRTPTMLVGLVVILMAIFTSFQRIERIEPPDPAPAGSGEPDMG